MTETAQFDFDFQNPSAEFLLREQCAEFLLREQWALNERAQAEQFTTEMYAMHWCGIHHKEDWESLPRYERHRIVTLYKAEQADLEWAIERWRPDYEVFHPTGEHTFVPPRPFRIRDFNRVNFPVVTQRELDEFRAHAQEMADQLSADWSANRPASIHTYNPFLAAEVSRILGRKIESIYPPPEVADAVPVLWKIFTALEQTKQ